jgi:hypothetical protein
MARPKKELDLPEDWYNSVLDLYKSGASDVEIKAWIYEQRGSFSNDLWDRWIKEEIEFSETIKIGKILSEAWWSKTGRKNLENKEFSFTGWYMNMKNRFGWKDKQEVEQSGGIHIKFENPADYVYPSQDQSNTGEPEGI